MRCAFDDIEAPDGKRRLMLQSATDDVLTTGFVDKLLPTNWPLRANEASCSTTSGVSSIEVDALPPVGAALAAGAMRGVMYASICRSVG